MADIDIFDALSSPTRRRILAMLRSGPRAVNDLTEGVGVTQPAVSQHLRVLHTVQLVQVTREGNQRIYRLDPSGLNTLRKYVEGFWDGVLEAYQEAANQIATED
jgi:DNA-binding transcriptional ArsR family regulator